MGRGAPAPHRGAARRDCAAQRARRRHNGGRRRRRGLRGAPPGLRRGLRQRAGLGGALAPQAELQMLQSIDVVLRPLRHWARQLARWLGSLLPQLGSRDAPSGAAGARAAGRCGCNGGRRTRGGG